ncbi:MAG: universal stress protein [Bilophila wadsworthia]|uniref:universal stress protein n=1 Tax=Bilophila wadsworthia TaxID=35833 RepID=UPI00300F1A19
MAYNRILLPVDGSEHSMHAVAHAVSLVREGGEIVVATVLPPSPTSSAAMRARKPKRPSRPTPASSPSPSWTSSPRTTSPAAKRLFSIPLPPKASSKPPKT